MHKGEKEKKNASPGLRGLVGGEGERGEKERKGENNA
jgi:hypothetical protein